MGLEVGVLRGGVVEIVLPHDIRARQEYDSDDEADNQAEVAPAGGSYGRGGGRSGFRHGARGERALVWRKTTGAGSAKAAACQGARIFQGRKGGRKSCVLRVMRP